MRSQERRGQVKNSVGFSATWEWAVVAAAHYCFSLPDTDASCWQTLPSGVFIHLPDADPRSWYTPPSPTAIPLAYIRRDRLRDPYTRLSGSWFSDTEVGLSLLRANKLDETGPRVRRHGMANLAQSSKTYARIRRPSSDPIDSPLYFRFCITSDVYIYIYMLNQAAEDALLRIYPLAKGPRIDLSYSSPNNGSYFPLPAYLSRLAFPKTCKNRRQFRNPSHSRRFHKIPRTILFMDNISKPYMCCKRNANGTCRNVESTWKQKNSEIFTIDPFRT